MADIEPGGRIGPFIVEGVIGRGGMGVVYRARDERLSRSVALKVISPHLVESGDYRERFISEARSAASVDHRGIVPIFEVDEADGQLYIAMRLVEGEDLSAYAKRRSPMSVEEALRVLAPVAEALDAAAKRGLVHRDVKPSNILVADPDSTAPEVLLSDFGLAKTQGDAGHTQTGQFVGSVDYVAPEQIATGVVDGRADQYALACVFYELLAGEPPFRRAQPMQTLFAQVNDPIPALTSARPELSGDIDEALARGLAKNPNDRFGSSAGMINALAAAVGEAPVANESSTSMPIIPAAVAGAGAGVAPRQSATRRRSTVIGVAVLILVVAIGVGFFATRNQTGDSGGQLASTATTKSGGESVVANEEQATALSEAKAFQVEFEARSKALRLSEEQCQRLDSPEAVTECFLEPTRIAEQAALAEQAGQAAMELPGLLQTAGVGDAERCSSAVARLNEDWATREAAWIRANRALRRGGYDSGDVSTATAWVKYRRLATNGAYAPLRVNQFAVNVACAPSPNWSVSPEDAEARLAALHSYYEALNLFALSGALTSYCYALVGGTYTIGSNDETTVKTCSARNANPKALRAEQGKLADSFGSLVAIPSWSDVSLNCRTHIRQAFNIVEKMIDHTAKWDAALSNNAPESVFAELKAQEGEVGFEKRVQHERRLYDCLTPKAPKQPQD